MKMAGQPIERFPGMVDVVTECVKLKEQISGRKLCPSQRVHRVMVSPTRGFYRDLLEINMPPGLN